MTKKFDLQVPQMTGETLIVPITTGEILFVLGANGVGKSSLVTRLHRDHIGSSKRISAHRQTWFQSNTLDMTPSSRDSMEGNIRSQDSQERSRYHQEYASQRASLAIFDLIDADTNLARKIADLVRAGDLANASTEAARPSPLSVMNKIMKLSNIPIEISVEERQRVVARKRGSEPYSVAELSDGERNAFLVAADVLTAKPGTLLIIDEPERHLHRSIVSPLLTLLLAERPDCAFVVSTHELALAADNKGSSSLLIRDCTYSGSTPVSWKADLFKADTSLDDTLRFDILGARQKMIFIEGEEHSLDATLYSLLFPQISIISKNNCRDVEYAVTGLRHSENKHWIKAWGIVDSDRRGADDVTRLKALGIFAVPYFSVEALYYHSEIVNHVAHRLAAVTGQDAEVLAAAALKAALDEARKSRDHFIRDAVERLARRELIESLPTKKDFLEYRELTYSIDVNKIASQEEAEFDLLLSSANYDGIIGRYPVRESGMLSRIASTIGLKSRNDYENSVRALVASNDDARNFLRSLFGNLVNELEPPVTV